MNCRGRRGFAAFSTVFLVLHGASCAPTPLSVESVSREGTVGGMSVRLNIKEAKAPELSWAVTDRVIATFSGHRVEVDKRQVTLDSKTKPLPSNTEGVLIEFENNTVTIRADGKPIFGPTAR